MRDCFLARLTFTVLVLVACCFALPSSSQALVIMDFDDAAPGELLTTPYFENGFRMLADDHYDLGYGWMNIDNFHSFNPIAKFDYFDKSFDFLSVDIALWESGILNTIAFITSSKAGYYEISGVRPLSFSGAEWRDIKWVGISISTPFDPYQPDGPGQINLASDNYIFGVPESSSILLLGIGLLGLAGLGRKRFKQN